MAPPISHRRASDASQLQSRFSRIAQAALRGVYLNLLWLVGSLLIVTAPASAVALLRSVHAWRVEGEEPSARAFLRTLRSRLLTSLLVAAGCLVIAAWLWLDITIAAAGNVSRIVLVLLLGIGIGGGMIAIASWWQLAIQSGSALKTAVSRGAKRAIRTPIRGLAALIVTGAGVAVAIHFPVSLMILPAIVAAIVDRLFWRSARADVDPGPLE